MCKKMAHSAQLNIKVDPPFSVGCRCFRLSVFLAFASSFGLPGVLALAGCRSVGSCFAGVARCGVGSAVGVGLPVGWAWFAVWISLFRLYLNFTISAKYMKKSCKKT